jgi:hypothetical protein
MFLKFEVKFNRTQEQLLKFSFSDYLCLWSPKKTNNFLELLRLFIKKKVGAGAEIFTKLEPELG